MLLGPGPAAAAVLDRLAKEPLVEPVVALVLDATPRSVVLQEPGGRGAILTDLRGGPDQPCPPAFLESLRSGVDLVHATNIGWALDVAAEARRLGLPVTTDLQALADPEADAYNRRFAALADHILFSGENLAVPPGDALACLLGNSPARAAVCTLGADGVLLAERDVPGVLAIPAEPVSGAAASTGAGDAFAAGYAAATVRGLAPADAARHAVRAAACFLRGERI
jgi:sugar/nucleoside kinase (ribokinase family)